MYQQCDCFARIAAAVPLAALPEEWNFDTSPVTELTQIGLNEEWQLMRNSSVAPWRGTADVSARVSLGWHANGLFFRFEVTDDDIRNDREAPELWQQDCLELFLAPPKGRTFRLTGGEADRMQILLGPPAKNGRVKNYIFCPVPCDAGLLQLRGQRTGDGYYIELFVPRTMLGENDWREGTEIRMQLLLDDSDVRGDTIQTRSFSFGGKRGAFSETPDDYLPFRFCADTVQGETTLLDPFWHATAKNRFPDRIQIEATPFGDAILATLTGTDGIFRMTATLPPTGDILTIPAEVPDGAYTLTLQPNRDGKPLGVRHFPIINLSRTLWRLGKLVWAELAARDPWRACAWLSVVSTVEFIKAAAIARQSEADLRRAFDELDCRLALLDGKPLPENAEEPLWLLELSRGFEAQIAVEFSRSNWQQMATVVIPWGDFPLVNSQIYPYSDAVTAQNRLELLRELQFQANKIAIPGADDAFFGTGHMFDGAQYYDLVPEVMVSLISARAPRTAYRLNWEEAQKLAFDAVAFTDDAPETMRHAVETFAVAHHIPVIALEARVKYRLVLIAGQLPMGMCDAFMQSLCGIPTDSIIFRCGRMLYETTGSPRELGMEFASFLLTGQPLTKELAEHFRSLRAAALPEPNATAQCAAAELWIGDTHTHTLYSDGTTTPAGLAAEALYAGLSFLVVSDHNLTDGALALKQIEAESGFNFPLVVGEEITMNNKFHLNLYPLISTVDCNLRFDDLVAAAHAQGAIVQWNHPTSWGTALNRYWFHGGNIVERDGINAVERNLEHFERWRAAGKLPVYVGSTDTHMGIFGHFDSTVVRTREFSGAALAEAIRTRHAAMINCRLNGYVYGDEAMTAAVVAALRQSEETRERFRRRLIRVLQAADLVRYISLSDAVVNGADCFLLINPASNRVDFEKL